MNQRAFDSDPRVGCCHTNVQSSSFADFSAASILILGLLPILYILGLLPFYISL